MRHQTAGRRHRNRGHGSGNNNQGGQRRGSHNRMQVFDSNGPDVRIRGTAHQVVEKYLTLAKDANSAGDRVLAESYLQHAEHYQRIINTWEDDVQSGRQQFASSDRPQNTPAQAEVSGNVRADLALPASILGGVPKQESQESADQRANELSTI